MEKLKPLGHNINAFTFQFDDSLLNEIRNSYSQHLYAFLTNTQNQYLFTGNKKLRQTIAESHDEYFLVSFDSYPLLWISCNRIQTYQIYKNFFENLDIHKDIQQLIKHKKNIVMYCGFLVVGDRALDYRWHDDYCYENAYTLLTPLFALDNDQGNLLYKTNHDEIQTYPYKLNEAVIIGNNFIHTTEPYYTPGKLRVLLSLTFGSDNLMYWPLIRKTVGNQSNFLMLPCGHVSGTCECLLQLEAFF